MTGERAVVDFARCCWECCASLWVLLKGDWAPVVHRPRPISIRLDRQLVMVSTAVTATLSTVGGLVGLAFVAWPVAIW
jgi:hypothetical protein